MSSATPDTRSAFAQSASSDRREESRRALDDLLASVGAAAVPTGVLLGRAPVLSHLETLDGGSGSSAVSQRDWEQLCHDLEKLTVPGAEPVVRLARVRAAAASMHADGVTPIVVIDARYHRTSAAFAARLRQAVRDRSIPALKPEIAGLLEETPLFAACAIAPPRMDGVIVGEAALTSRRVTFQLDRSSYLTNRGAPPADIEIDFGDGRGFRRVALGERVTIEYSGAGDKTLRYAVRDGAGTRHAASVSLVQPLGDSLNPDATWSLQATIPYKDVTNTGKAYVFYGTENGRKHTALTNPAVVLHPISVDPYSLDDWNALVGSLMPSLAAAGVDVVLLSPDKPSDYIQRTAFVAVACLTQIQQQRVAGRPTVALGLNLGAVAARYALGYMERHALDHGTGYYVSFDGPHQGMNIPVSLQWIISLLANVFGQSDAQKQVALFTSLASRQLLYYYLPSWDYSGSLIDPLHGEFVADLRQQGYPAKPLNVAVSTGTRDGVAITGFDITAVKWSGNPATTGDIHTSPNNGGTGRSQASYIKTMKDYWIDVTVSTAYDEAPGSTLNGFQQLATALGKSSYTGTVENPVTAASLVPTISAIDWATTDPYTVIEYAVDTNPKSPFDLFVIEQLQLQQGDPLQALHLLLGLTLMEAAA